MARTVPSVFCTTAIGLGSVESPPAGLGERALGSAPGPPGSPGLIATDYGRMTHGQWPSFNTTLAS